ncbi:MAG: hypothetical protein JST11_22455 [Acidobacteria bacterium]|nr:hypothetical protein [Acidobacteriota bacterium]
MFGIDWSNSQTLWLNLTNLALGIVTVLAVVILCGAVAQELLARRRKARELAGMDEEMRHVLHVPELGLTMADGGEAMPAPTERPGVDQKRS